jgi:hypothetical protein
MEGWIDPEGRMNDSDLIKRALGEPEEDPVAIGRARARLHGAIRIEEARKKRHRFMLPAAAIVAITTTVAIAVSLIGPFGGGLAAATELRRLATIALSTSTPDVRPGEFLFVESDELRRERIASVETGSSYTLISRLHIRTWIGRNGGMFRLTEVIASDFATENDQRVWAETDRSPIPRAGEVRRERTPPGESFWVDVSRLPENASTLLTELRSRSVVPQAPGDDQVFLVVGQLLAQGDGPPEVRAALFRAAARLNGVEVLGDLPDPLGRPGLALAMDVGSLRTQLIVDPETAHLLAIELYDVASDGSVAAEPQSWSAYQPATVVDALPTEG